MLSMLKSNGLSRFADVLEDEGVTFDVILDLTVEDFTKMGFSIGDKMRILKGARDHGGRVEGFGEVTKSAIEYFDYPDNGTAASSF